jgi:hypothetical protein
MARERLAAAVVLGVAALVHGWLAWSDQGVFWPDEIYQSLEQAHRLLFGYGIAPWEFEQGARSWIFPGFIAAFWKVLAELGVDGSVAVVVGAKALMGAITVLGIWATMRLAAHYAGPPAGLVAGLLALAFPPLLLLGTRALSEVPSAALVVLATLLALSPEPRRLALAGLLAGLACFLRYQNGIIGAGLVALVWSHARWAGLRWYLLAGSLTVLLGGLLDWATWGSPSHALRAYLQYNLIEGQAARYGVAGAGFYAEVAATSTGPACVALALGCAFAARRAAGPLLIALAYVLAHMAVGHKEYRFVLPVLPLLLALAAAGLVLALQRVAAPRLAAPALGIVLAGAMAANARTLTYDQLGLYRGLPASAFSPWHFYEGANRLLWEAGRRDDLCGLWISGARRVWTGGYSYLHRPAPLLWGFKPERPRHANYILVPPAWLPVPMVSGDGEIELPAAYRPVARSGGWTLLRREGQCLPLPEIEYGRFQP